ncbi:MAG: phosphoglucosamine mutase [Syntrophobacterales bacterium CG_4_8_14_3_um_filter_58_8]|nr:MAG: phosphoglucosamine mutase [Syntrophaceae bacterium CG2_30_58_14]PIV06451.1 MAG: phosphoglucosamine mutase [Syntrophobacterales bacterium CG03_land_8_20_14_0_80_58_14]PJC74690.1 MAG: phosphoglucosamine mutase [Syntrophobacterales bacterium CG_4_8_14_3_um_filter_58_8]
MGKLFGTDGIRGVANEHPMTAEMAMNIGRATAHLFKKRGHVPKIIIGKDTRISGYMLENALVSGICSMGVHAILVGVLPTPGIAFLTGSMRADAGIVISASHNPFQDNGIKIFGSEGFKLPDETEKAIEEIVFANNLHTLHPSPSELGKAYRMEDARGRYIVFLKHAFPKECSLEGTRIVLDCSNGAAYRVAPETFIELGAEVTTLFDEPNGKNINLQCGSQHPETLAKAVRKAKADIGFAFDGDGDRVIAVDETGAVMTGDLILAICAASMKKEGALTNNLVVRTVMSNIGLGLAFESLGIDSVMTGVGDRCVIEEMQARGASLGGEDSGHLIFLRHHTTGDGIITALQVAATMKKEGKPLSKLAKIMKVFPQRLINVNVKSRPEIETAPEIMAAIREVERRLGDQGRVLVRYSGTQNMCRVMVEGPTPEETEHCCREIAEVVDKTLNA